MIPRAKYCAQQPSSNVCSPEPQQQSQYHERYNLFKNHF